MPGILLEGADGVSQMMFTVTWNRLLRLTCVVSDVQLNQLFEEPPLSKILMLEFILICHYPSKNLDAQIAQFQRKLFRDQSFSECSIVSILMTGQPTPSVPPQEIKA